MMFYFLECKICDGTLAIFDIIVEMILKLLSYWGVVEIDEGIM